MTSTTTHTFQADISELLNLIINSFYSNKEVFLRELLSNASDAIDKKRHTDLVNQVTDQNYHIRISPDFEKKALVIEDDGVGMSYDDLIHHLSTIAKSGTKEFVKNLKEKSEMIGQFGVGFYASFLVADTVEVVTKKEGNPTFKWSSSANEVYTIEEVEDRPIGTRIVLYLKDDCHEYLREDVIKNIITLYSQFISYPIKMYVQKTIEVEEEAEEAEEGDVETGDVEEVEEDGVKVEDVETEQEAKKKKTRTETVYEWVDVTIEKPLWYKNPKDVTEGEYASLYKVLSKDYDDPLYYRHFKTEGSFEFKGIFYVPKKSPYNILTDFSRDKRNIQLYVKRVMIMPHLEKDMMPDWMNFVFGVIDSADLPLNVSREMLQQTKVLNAMRTQIKKQIMNMLNDLLKTPEKYDQFYASFRKNIKLGVHEGEDGLLRFIKVACNEKNNVIFLDDYLEKHLQEGQDSIYYITGEDAERSLMASVYRNRGYSVLLFNEPIDEFMFQKVFRYKEKEFVNIAKDHKTPWQKEEGGEEEGELKEFCEWYKTTLGDPNVESVRVSKTLDAETDDPCIVLSSKFGWTGNMEKLMKAQPLNDNSSYGFMKGKKLVELNLHHPIVKLLKESKDEGKARLLYQSSLVAAGFPLDNPVEFSKMVQGVLSG